MAFTTGTATFTSGSRNVTGVVLSGGSTSYFGPGTRVVVGSNPVVAEVEAVAAPSAGTFTLRDNWSLPTGTYTFLANMTSEGLRDAVSLYRQPIDAATLGGQLPSYYASVNYVNSFGLGSSSPVNTADIDTLLTGGFFSYGFGATGSPDGNGGATIAIPRPGVGFSAQINLSTTGEIFSRLYNSGVWGPDVKHYSDVNLIHAQNTSGATVTSNATTAGSNLTPTQTGTWRNVSGNDILNNGYGLWLKV